MGPVIEHRTTKYINFLVFTSSEHNCEKTLTLVCIITIISIENYAVLASHFYPPQGGSMKIFFWSLTSSYMVNTGQLRSITVN